ncbi:MAG: hypothetical protein NWF06_10090 [Candidatus Bathyarchaeota archaeon]|nr:hypothetical protein [Candidatus Bathyarchaeum sp.]
MPKKAHITVNLLPEASKSTTTQIKGRIRNNAKIPLCKEIEAITIEDIDASYENLKKHGISSNVARNLMDLYTE